MDKFEYITYSLDDKKYGQYGVPDYEQRWIPATLAELGEKGWEIAMPLVGSRGTGACILKRKIEDPSNEELYKTISRATYTGALMALEQFEKQRAQGQAPQRRPAPSEYEYGR